MALAGIFVVYGSIWLADFYVPAGSEEQLRRAIADNPADSASRIELARLLSKRKAQAEAALILHEGLKRSPHEPELYRAKIRTYLDWAQAHDKYEAVEHASRYLKMMAKAGYAAAEDYEALANTQFTMKRYVDAAKAYAQAFALAPQNKRLQEWQYESLIYSGKYEEAQAFFRKLSAVEPNNPRAWMLLGTSQYYLGQYDDSVASLTKAASFAFTNPQDRKQVDERLAYAKSLQSRRKGSEEDSDVHYCLGNSHRGVNREDRMAAELEIAIETGALKSCRQGWALYNTADFYSSIMEYDRALDLLKRAVEIDTKLEEYDELSFVYQRLAGVYENLASLEEKKSAAANEYHELALKARQMQLETCHKAGNKHMETHAVADYADLLLDYYGVEDERTQQARSEMLGYMPRDGEELTCATSSVLSTEAQIRYHEKDYAGAEDLFLRDGAWLAWRPMLGGGVTAYSRLAYIAHEQGDYGKGIEYGKQAILLANRVRALQGSDLFRQQIGATSRAGAFETLARNAVKNNDTKTLFDCSEQYKAQALLELLGSKTANVQPPQPLVMANVEPNPALLSLAEAEPQANPAAATRNLNIEGTGYGRLPEDTRVADRQIPSFKSVAALTLEEAQSFLDNATLISYGIASEHSVAMVIGKDRAFSCELEGVTEAVLREHVERLRLGMGLKESVQRDLNLESADWVPATDAERDTAFQESSQKLYALLIEPLRPHLQTNLVCISADGILNYLPFEALSKDGHYLIEDFAISYTPSATVLKYCMDKERHKRESILALGNPNLQNPAFRLVNAEEEVASLRGLFRRADVYTGTQANERVVRETASQYDVLHFACHGELNSEQPMLTSLRLSPSEADDGYLHAGEVFDLDLNASLVVLSACNSGLGKLHSGNELMGLTRSFLYAGAPAIIASMWTVDDRSTAQIMQHFYRNLSQMTKAEALRQAKLATMKEFPNPFHWAAFCLQGDYR